MNVTIQTIINVTIPLISVLIGAGIAWGTLKSKVTQLEKDIQCAKDIAEANRGAISGYMMTINTRLGRIEGKLGVND